MENRNFYNHITIKIVVFIGIETLLVLLCLSGPVKEVYIMALLYQIQLVIVTQAKHIKNILFKGAVFVRRSLYFIPYIISLCWFGDQLFVRNIDVFKTLSSCILAFLFALLLYMPQIKKIHIYFLKDFNILLGPRSNQEVALDVYSSLMSAVFQEVFYKCCILHVLTFLFTPMGAIMASALLFSIEHYFHFAAGERFYWRDYITQFLMSGLGGWLYLYSGSVLAPVIMHLTYNLPRTISYVVRNYQNKVYQNTKKGEGTYDL